MPKENERYRLLVEKGRRKHWWQRKGSMARGFSYVARDGRKIADDISLEKIKSIVIPPAWRHVRISPSASGKIQAVGVDTSGRLQYIYHPKFAEKQKQRKFARIEKFGEYLPQFRSITNEHISLDGFPQDKVFAIMTRLINLLYIRMGTDKSVKQHRTYGITTLGKKHITISPKGKVVFEFVGKSHVKHKKVLVDAEFAGLLKELTNLGRGRKLFQYIDDEENLRAVKPAQLNGYIKSVTANEYSAKDFRTWGASLLSAIKLAEIGVSEDESQVQKNIKKAVTNVAAQLGNTLSVCLSSYVHPKILEAYRNGVVLDSFTPSHLSHVKRISAEVVPEEISLLKLFKKS
jgi:DNA topoisomerase-1